MALWQLSDLITRVRQQADMVYSHFVTDLEVTSYINASYADWYNLVTKAYTDYFLPDPITFTVSNGSNYYLLDTNFYKLVGVDFLDSGLWLEVRSFDFNE